MSVASVLEREGNVRDFVETPVLGEKPVWDRISKEDIMEEIAVVWSHIPFMGLDVNVLPELRQFIDFYKEWISEDFAEKLQSQNRRELGVEIFMDNLGVSRLLERDISEDLENVRELYRGKEKLAEIIHDCQEGSPEEDALAFIFHFKVCYPSEDVESAVTSFLTRYQNYIENVSDRIFWETNEQLINKLKELAFLKLLKPELFEGVDIVGSRLYQLALERAEEEINTGGRRVIFAVNLSSYLKFFAAEKVEFGPTGITLTMPQDLSVPSSPSMPEPRRFDS
jgi:hypothetical protein